MKRFTVSAIPAWLGLGILLLVLTASAIAWARPVPSVPTQVSIQGTLTDAVGNPLMGDRAWRIQFYDAETGGNALGGVSSGTLSVGESGRWSISFTPPDEAVGGDADVGGSSPKSPSIDMSTEVWYEIAIDSAVVPDGAIDPVDVFPNRVRVESVMFARKATDSENLGGISAGEYATGSDLTSALAGKADSAHTHNLQDLGGATTDAQVPDDITIDHAASADFATSTSEATHASTADEATHAADADNAASATLAGHATTADEATHAALADTATTAAVAIALEPTLADLLATDAELATGLAAKSDTTHSHNLQDLGGAATDAQVPDTITISSSGAVDAAALKSGTVPSARLSLGDADVPDNVTISSSGSVDAAALKSGTIPSDRLSLGDADVPNSITIDHSATADTATLANAAKILTAGRFVMVETTTNASTNATALLAAYAAAKTLSPASGDRVTVIVPPARYNFGTSALTLDTDYIDLVGLTTNRAGQYIYGTSNGSGTGVLRQTANDVRIENLMVECTRASGGVSTSSSDPAAYYPVATTTSTIVSNCEFVADDINAWSMRIRIRYPGTYKDSVAGRGAFGGENAGGIASGTFTDCVGGRGSFGAGGASGTFVNCVGGYRSFGCFGTADGTFDGCRAGGQSFGWPATGTFRNCTGDYQAFAGGAGGEAEAVASGTFIDCTGGMNSFGGAGGIASGTFRNCVAGIRSFAGNGGTASGTFTSCGGGDNSFGGTAGTTTDGKFYHCTGGANSYVAGGTFVYCVKSGAEYP